MAGGIFVAVNISSITSLLLRRYNDGRYDGSNKGFGKLNKLLLSLLMSYIICVYMKTLDGLTECTMRIKTHNIYINLNKLMGKLRVQPSDPGVSSWFNSPTFTCLV